MPNIDIPFYGSLLLGVILVSAGYAFAVSVAAARGRPHLLPAARASTYATCALVALAVLVLAYAFQTHDFRIRYVARYSDRSMPWYYLLTSLWGGQDGSLLWWTFLLCGYTAAVTRSLRGRHLELQPIVLATLMSIVSFFVVTMLFAANPFATYAAASPADGEGLNPLLQNYWMIIHPPSLYLGFVGWSVPFAFCIAALVTGRLGDEWIVAARRWSLIAWLFLSIGLVLGMIWSYEELGWGGYWAWDPVENASFMPWLVGTAYLHSVMIQERRGMMKVWNVFLMCLTFFMTIFGTFLTRSGLIASVHSFARSDIGIWFAGYMGILVVVCAALIIWRLPLMRAKAQIESYLSREFAFLFNNWILLAMMGFVLVLTTYPLISELLRGEEATVGPNVYNALLVPIGLLLVLLMGIGPLIAWRKATGRKLVEAFRFPLGLGLAIGAGHAVFGDALGFPGKVEVEPIFDTGAGVVLAAFQSISPVFGTAFVAFVTGTILQEFWRGMRVRMRKGEHPGAALVQLVGRARRRYGGYVVHLGIALMYLGFVGAAYDVEKEAALRPGESMSVRGYDIRYDDVRTVSDPNKRMVFTDLSVFRGDRQVGEVSPGKFIYRTHPEMPTTEVAIRTNLGHDVYAIMSTVDPESKRGTFRVIIRPFVLWIWLGGIVLILGTAIAITPTVSELLAAREASRSDGPGRPPAPAAGGGGVPRPIAAATGVLLLLAAGAVLAWGLFQPSFAAAQSSSLHAGTVTIEDPEERRLFQRLLCECGSCQRLALDTCGCSWAEDTRAEIRQRLAHGATFTEIVANYRAEHGPAAISVPEDAGLGRAMWVVPLSGILLAAVGVVWLGRRWMRRDAEGAGSVDGPGRSAASAGEAAPGDDARYESLLDDELRRLEGEL
jgi:cytochrome c-type biogenesis protein CcmF